MPIKTLDIVYISKILKEGGVILYPTEGVYGIGCNPFDYTAVKRLLSIKKRNTEQGLILISAHWQQVKNLINIDLNKNKILYDNNPITWVIPATEYVPSWIKGKHDTVAIRVTQHPIIKNICIKFNNPIVSTSANISTEHAPLKFTQIKPDIISAVDLIVDGETGNLGKSSTICELITHKIYRL